MIFMTFLNMKSRVIQTLGLSENIRKEIRQILCDNMLQSIQDIYAKVLFQMFQNIPKKSLEVSHDM